VCLSNGNFVLSVSGERVTPAAALSIAWALEDARNSAVAVRGSRGTVATFTIVAGALQSVMLFDIFFELLQHSMEFICALSLISLVFRYLA